MIKAVLFDLDGTLYDRDALASALVRAQYDAFAADLGELPREEFVRQVLEMDDHGYGDKGVGYAALAQRWELGAGLGARLEKHFWSVYDDYCRLSDDVRATLDTLRNRGLKLGVVTNGSGARQRAKLAALGLATAFDVVLISELEGVRKPDAEIFRRALYRCGVGAHEALFVGDHPAADVDGALGAGLSAVWKYVPYWRLTAAQVPVVRDLAEILPLAFGTARAKGAALVNGENG